MFFLRKAGMRFVDRGDPDAYDIDENDLTQNTEWQDLDLSAIVPANAKHVYMRFIGMTMTLGAQMYFRKSGNNNDINIVGIEHLVNGRMDRFSFWVPISAEGGIQYKNGLASWLGVDITVKGWLIG